ncbi:MAG: EF-hand domain-containing protein [Verrucomicrobia bacterium]|nr:EF-hand domain-containing protein [Verrucomicrobiota bacterium]
MPSADMMARMDTDKDGKLSEKEFAAANQRPAEGRGPGQGKGGGEGQRARPPE